MDEPQKHYKHLLRTLTGSEAIRATDCWLIALYAAFVLLLDTHVLSDGRTGLSDPQRNQIVQIFRENLSSARRLTPKKGRISSRQ